MTGPHDAGFDLSDNVTYSDTPDTTFQSPAISISPSEAYGRRVSATNPAIAFSSSHAVPSGTAYDAGDPSNHSVRHTNGLHIDNTSSTQLPSSTATTASASLNLAAYASQPWISPSVPYLHFAPQPLYEPTGELIHEETVNFHEFDNPAILRSLSDSNSESPQDSLTATVPSQPTKAVNASVPPAPPRSALKRKADTLELPLSNQGRKHDRPSNKTRSVSFERMSGREPASPDETRSSEKPSGGARAGAGATQQGRKTRQSATSTGSRPAQSNVSQPPSDEPQTHRGSLRSGTRVPSGHPPSILPPEKVFPIQIGSDLFRLSGASISSDAPSYFTQFFEEQIRQNEESGGVRTLYIDRDPETFRDVARHLQGYYVKPRDGSHFVKLFADAQFYSLPRLIDQLFESEIFIQIGERHFQIPKDIFSEPGNSPNFFSLGFAVFFSTPGEVFPGLDRRGLLRPPSITPPYVPGRSAEIFSELLHLLRGYPLHIRNENHRAELLRDCRYFHLRGLEQKIIAHDITYNLAREKHEITLRLEDVKPSGVSFTSDSDADGESHNEGGWVYYARPFVDETSYEMVIEIGGECTVLDLEEMRADFHNLTKARISSLFQVVANKMNLPTNAPLGLMILSGGGNGGIGSASAASPGHTPLSEDRVKVRFDINTAITVDGRPYEPDPNTAVGRTMLHGASASADAEDSNNSDSDDDEDESDADEEMSNTPRAASARGSAPARQVPTTTTHRPTPPGQQQRQQQTGKAPSSRPSAQQSPPPLQVPSNPRTSSSSLSKKRKRQAQTSSSSSAGAGPSKGPQGQRQEQVHSSKQWLIRTAQWRLRVQPNPNDKIRGGFEIVFVGVKIDAFTAEKGRNERRSFLGGGD